MNNESELTITPADIAEVERLIIAVDKHIKKVEKWIKEG